MYIALDLSHKPVPHDQEKREGISNERKFKSLYFFRDELYHGAVFLHHWRLCPKVVQVRWKVGLQRRNG